MASNFSLDEIFVGAKSLFLSLKGTYVAMGYKIETIKIHNFLIIVLLVIIQLM